MNPTRPILALAGLLSCYSPATAGLTVIDRDGTPTLECPLRRTEVTATVTGFLSRVTVVQHFENTSSTPVEAVYTFPLPAEGAVDRMTMAVGSRTIEARIKPREEARAIFDAARQSGRRASLLEQERPNVFTQSVTNLLPGDKVQITLSYVAPLKYEAGAYEFQFPMVVGPRYNPQGLADGKRLTPPVAPPAMRAGHDIQVEVSIDAGVPIRQISSVSHPIVSEQSDSRHARVRLKDAASIPNKDFILRYAVAGEKVEDAVLAHKGAKGGFFTLILQPPARPAVEQITPKELVFVVDTSGSMHGFPLEKSKELMRMALSNMNPGDMFNIITFAGDTHLLFPEPVPATPENVQKARIFLEGRRGSGGTEMMKAIHAALAPSASSKHVRVVAFLTDGYIGNDMEVIGEVRKNANARVFAFGIGNATNRYLLDKMAEEGRGDVDYVTLNEDGSAAARRFFEKIRNPLLTDVKIDFGGLPVSDIYPARIPDLFSGRPLVIYGRYAGGARGAIRLTGRVAGKEYARTVDAQLPAAESKHDVLATLWARARVEELTARDYAGVQNGTLPGELRDEITRLGLDYRLMTPFTAFVAVEEKAVNEGGKVRRVQVPVEMPEGVSHQGVFGDQMAKLAAPTAVAPHGSGMAYESRARVTRRAEPEGPPALPQTDKPGSAAPVSAKIHPHLSAKNTGVLQVKVYVADLSASTVAALQKAGLQVERQDVSGNFLLARIDASKLAELAKSPLVRFIAPAA